MFLTVLTPPFTDRHPPSAEESLSLSLLMVHVTVSCRVNMIMSAAKKLPKKMGKMRIQVRP